MNYDPNSFIILYTIKIFLQNECENSVFNNYQYEEIVCRIFVQYIIVTYTQKGDLLKR